MTAFAITFADPDLFDKLPNIPKADRHTVKFSLFDDDGNLYFHGFLDESDDGVTGDAWLDAYEWGGYFAGAANIMKGHVKRLDRDKVVIG